MCLWMLLVLLCAEGGLGKAVAVARPPGEGPEGLPQSSEGKRALTALASQENSVGRSSSKFFGGMMPSSFNPNQGMFPSPMGGYNMGGYPSVPYPYFPPTPYGYMNGPPHYAGYFPHNPGFYGNNFGGYAATQQQQQQQTSQMGAAGVGMGGFQPPFGG